VAGITKEHIGNSIQLYFRGGSAEGIYARAGEKEDLSYLSIYAPTKEAILKVCDDLIESIEERKRQLTEGE